MSSIRRTLLIFLVLFAVSSTAYGAAGRTKLGHSYMAVDPTSAPAPDGPSTPDNGEPDGGGQSKTQSGSSSESTQDTLGDVVGLIRWLGKIMLERNLGIGL